MGLRVDDIDGTYQSAIGSGGQSSQILTVLGSMHIAQILDPNGREIELICRR